MRVKSGPLDRPTPANDSVHRSPSCVYCIADCIAAGHRARIVRPQVHLFDAIPDAATARLVDGSFKDEKHSRDRLVADKSPGGGRPLPSATVPLCGQDTPLLADVAAIVISAAPEPRADRPPSSVSTRAHDTSISYAAVGTVRSVRDRVADTDRNAHIADVQAAYLALDAVKLRAVAQMSCHSSSDSGKFTARLINFARARESEGIHQ